MRRTRRRTWPRIYKSYFKLLIDKDFTKAWDGLANESKLTIAELIAKEAKAPSDKVLGMLNTNEKRAPG